MNDKEVTCFYTGWSALLDVELWVKWMGIFASIGTVVIAGFALYVAHKQLNLGWKQLKSNRQEAKSATAHDLYHQYLILCIEKPEFSYGMAKPAERTMEYGKYCWFASSMLFTFEQILETMPDDEKWQATIKSQLLIHKEWLSISSTVREKQWDDSLQRLIEATIAGH
ncbi:hypothetical protein BCT75_12735 [Vibrio lentus]|uniref:hypothetical protein n=1 Tax=Vibrio lentus TaxID=136468 RepID=UPI000C82BF80|nr:hypothetical protein [Vibrio lentus]PML50660.1 hypothetical protein BCT75_12735 [Vibrio lentus]